MRIPSLVSLLAIFSLIAGCSLHSTATHWNGRVGPSGKPVHVTITTKIGFNALVFLPFLGDMAINGLVNDMTENVEAEGGDKVRVFQATTENYWYGFPPFTWIVTPVISTVAAEFEVGPGKVEAKK